MTKKAKNKANPLKAGLTAYPKALKSYCKTLNWDPDKLRIALTDEGIADENLYLDTPNIKVIDLMTRFLSLSESSIFVIHAPVGMGKSSTKDFTIRTLNNEDDYYVAAVNNPRMTGLQILKQVLRDITDSDSVPHTMDLVWNQLESSLVELRKSGITTIIWIDEAEKLNSEKLSLLRSLADVKTFDGLKVCKIILSGTPVLQTKVDRFLESNPEDAQAYDDRSALFTLGLSKWNDQHIFEWWDLLAEFSSIGYGGTNPFTIGAAEEVLSFSEGKPRSITQLTQMLLTDKASRIYNDKKENGFEITKDDVLVALNTQLNTQQEE